MPWTSTLAGDIDDSVQTIRLTSDFTPRRFTNFLTIESEVVQVTGAGARELSVLRGALGSEPVAHTAGAAVTRVASQTTGNGTAAAGEHPDLATHVALGLGTAHAHDFASSGHTHAIYAGTAHNHDSAYSATEHSHGTASHGHAQSDITNLATDLSGKAASCHNHDAADAATGHSHSHNHDGTYATAGHTHPGGSEAFPVGSIFLSVVSTNPATLLGYGTWSAFGAGRMLLGWNTGDTDEATGGASTHTHADHTDVINHTHPVTDPGHTHLTQRYPTATGGSSGFTIDTSMSGTLADNTLPTKSATTGVTTSNPAGGVSALTHDSPNHLPPYVIVRMWKRTA
jgi:hypothetical protein